MPKTRLISPGIANHSLKKNLILNGNYISNDGEDQGIRIYDGGGVRCNTDLISTGFGFIFDTDYDGTTSGQGVGLQVNGSLDGAVASGQVTNFLGLDVDTSSTNASTVGSINLVGVDIDVTGRTEGTQIGYGMDLNVEGSDTNYGIICVSADRQLRLGYDSLSYLDITVANDSHTTLTTAESGDLILNPSGDITLKPAGGDVVFHDGTGAIFKFDVALPSFYIYDDGDYDGLRDYFNITVGTTGSTTITTNDDSASNANLSFVIDGDISFSTGFDSFSVATGSHITLNSGGSIFLDAESGICRLTDDSETDNVFTPAHDADITTKKYVDDNLHAESHTVASHSDTTATGTELNTLTASSSSDASALHLHDTTKYYYHFIKCGFTSSSVAQIFIPLAASDDLAETTTALGLSEKLVMICPFDGSLETIWVRSSGTPGSTVVGYHHSAGSGAEIPSTSPTSSVTVDMATDDTSYKFDFTGVTNTFAQGDTIMFSIDPTSRVYDVHFMIVLKFDVTT